MIILEGPDLCGKTTLARALLKRLHSEEGYRKFGPYPAIYEHFDAPPTSWCFPKSYFPHIKRYSIHDRFHISELCYGVITRGASRLEPRGVRIVDALLALVGSLTVVITLKDAFLVQQWESKSRDEMFTLEQVRAVNEAYSKLPETHPELRIDMLFQVDGPGEFVAESPDTIDSILHEWSCRQAYIHSLTGSFYGKGLSL